MVKFNIQLCIFLAKLYNFYIVGYFLFQYFYIYDNFLSDLFLWFCSSAYSSSLPGPLRFHFTALLSFYTFPLGDVKCMSSIIICVIKDPELWISIPNSSFGRQIHMPPGGTSQMLFSCSSYMSTESNTVICPLIPFHPPVVPGPIGGESSFSSISKKAAL